MKELKNYVPVLLVFMVLTLSGCELIGDILEFGVWVGVIGVVLVVLLIMWVLRLFRRRP